MLALPATSSATPSLQSTLNRSRLEQARQQADQLEAQAQSLRNQADQAEGDAEKGQDKVRSLSAQSNSSSSTASDSTYSSAVKPAGAAEVPPKVQDFLVRMYSATSQKFTDSGNALKGRADTAPVLNTRGQATGRILNTEA